MTTDGHCLATIEGFEGPSWVEAGMTSPQEVNQIKMTVHTENFVRFLRLRLMLDDGSEGGLERHYRLSVPRVYECQNVTIKFSESVKIKEAAFQVRGSAKAMSLTGALVETP